MLRALTHDCHSCPLCFHGVRMPAALSPPSVDTRRLGGTKGPRGNESYTILTPRSFISAAEVLGIGWHWTSLACFKKYYNHLHRPDTGRCGLVVILFHNRSDVPLGSKGPVAVGGTFWVEPWIRTWTPGRRSRGRVEVGGCRSAGVDQLFCSAWRGLISPLGFYRRIDL